MLSDCTAPVLGHTALRPANTAPGAVCWTADAWAQSAPSLWVRVETPEAGPTIRPLLPRTCYVTEYVPSRPLPPPLGLWRRALADRERLRTCWQCLGVARTLGPREMVMPLRRGQVLGGADHPSRAMHQTPLWRRVRQTPRGRHASCRLRAGADRRCARWQRTTRCPRPLRACPPSADGLAERAF